MEEEDVVDEEVVVIDDEEEDSEEEREEEEERGERWLYSEHKSLSTAQRRWRVPITDGAYSSLLSSSLLISSLLSPLLSCSSLLLLFSSLPFSFVASLSPL